MTMYGANPDQLASLGRVLRQQTEPIQSLTTAVQAALSGTAWTGPARDRFEHDWNATFRPTLQRLSQAFEAAGADCVNRAQQLAQVMGAR